MNIGFLIPGFSAHADDWAIPVHQHLTQALAQQHDVRVIALRYPHTTQPYSVGDIQIYPLGVGTWTRGWRRFSLWMKTLKLIRNLHQEKPFDVLHALWADETGLLSGWAGKFLGIPSVVSIGGGELVGFDDLNYGLQRSRFSRWIVGQALQSATAIIAHCSYSANCISQAGYSIPSDKIHQIPLGAGYFSPPTIPPKKHRLIHVASLVPIKDQQTLLNAIARLNDIEIDIIGEGTEHTKLVNLAKDLGIASQVHFLGKVAHQDLEKHFHQATLHVLTSRHESFGMVTLEAASCGLPTIGTQVGILPDDNDLGVAVPVGDDKALADAIQVYLDMPHDKYIAHHQNTYQAIQSRYSITHVIEQWLNLYSSLDNSNL